MSEPALFNLAASLGERKHLHIFNDGVLTQLREESFKIILSTLSGEDGDGASGNEEEGSNTSLSPGEDGKERRRAGG